MEEPKTDEKILDRVSPDRRGFVKRILAGAAFATPVLATFAIDALNPRSANAMQSNVTVTPEPSSLLLMGAGAVGIGIAAHRKSKRDKDQAKQTPETGDQKPRE